MYPNKNIFTQYDVTFWAQENQKLEKNRHNNMLMQINDKEKPYTNDTVSVGLCSPLSETLKILNNELTYKNLEPSWYFSNYNQKIDLPSCAQIENELDLNKISSCCKESNRYCELQLSTNYYSKENLEKINENSYTIDKSNYIEDNLSEINTNYFNVYNLEKEKHFVDKCEENIIANKEISDSEEEFDIDVINNFICVLCNLSSESSENIIYFRVLNNDLITLNSRITILDKLSILIEKFPKFPKRDQQHICNLCLNLVNSIDCLEEKLKATRKELIEIFEKGQNLKKSVSIKEPLKRICKICNKYFFQNEIHHHKDIFKCNLCSKIFTMKRLLDVHLSKHSAERDHLCEICGKKFIHKSSLSLHIAKHKQLFKISCTECDKKFYHNTSYEVHKMTHTGEKPYTCNLCSKKFRTNSNLNEHTNVCSNYYPYECEKCPKKFTTSTRLTHHNKIKHEKDFKFVCEHCNKGFTKFSDYKKHEFKHSDLKQFKCSICPRQYTTLSNLNFHEKTHRNVFKFSCEMCEKKFNRKEIYEAHKNQHLGILKFQCRICDKKFASSGYLKCHLKIHDGVKTKRMLKKKFVSDQGVQTNIKKIKKKLKVKIKNK